MGRSLLAPVLLFWLWSPVWATDAVHFADPQLKAAVEETLWISDPTPEDIVASTSRARRELFSDRHAINMGVYGGTAEAAKSILSES